MRLGSRLDGPPPVTASSNWRPWSGREVSTNEAGWSYTLREWNSALAQGGSTSRARETSENFRIVRSLAQELEEKRTDDIFGVIPGAFDSYKYAILRSAVTLR